MSTVVTVQGKQPGCLVQLLWFVVIGWWAGQIWILLAWLFMATVIGIPLAVKMLNRLPYVIALRGQDPEVAVIQAGGVTVVSVGGERSQRNLLLRIVYFLLIGWWLSAFWIEAAYVFCLTIIGLPIGFWMFDKTPAVLSLSRRVRVRSGPLAKPTVEAHDRTGPYRQASAVAGSQSLNGARAVKPEAEPPFYLPPTWNRPLADIGAERPMTFGDLVRVRSTEETEAVGLADLVGIVFGQTIPSKSGVDVTLKPRLDYAIAVNFDELGKTLWLPHDVLEFISHRPGQQVGIQTSRGERIWRRQENGKWTEVAGG